MYARRTNDEKTIYEFMTIFAQIMADAIVKAIHEREQVVGRPSTIQSMPSTGGMTMMGQKESLVLSVSQAAKALGLSEATMRTAVNTGKVKALRIGRRILIPRITLNKFLEEAQYISKSI